MHGASCLARIAQLVRAPDCKDRSTFHALPRASTRLASAGLAFAIGDLEILFARTGGLSKDATRPTSLGQDHAIERHLGPRALA